MNYSDYKFENLEGASSEWRLGYFVGIAPNYRINEKIQFQIDFQYSLKGYDTGTENDLLPSEFRYGYLDILPEVEFHVKRHLALGAGINYGRRLQEQVKISSGDWSEPIVETINSSDFGLTFKLETNYKNVFGFARYTIGLKNVNTGIFTDENGRTIEDARQSSRNLQVGIGYKLDFKKNELQQ